MGHPGLVLSVVELNALFASPGPGLGNLPPLTANTVGPLEQGRSCLVYGLQSVLAISSPYSAKRGSFYIERRPDFDR